MPSNADVAANNQSEEDNYGANSDVNMRHNSYQKYTSPSDKARFHFRNTARTVMCVGREMSERDPYYKPRQNVEDKNPFLTIPLFTHGHKILNEGHEKPSDIKKVEKFLFSSCFELNPDLTDNDSGAFDFPAIDSMSTSKQTRKTGSEDNHAIIGKVSKPERRRSLPDSSKSTLKNIYDVNNPVICTSDDIMCNALSPTDKETVQKMSFLRQNTLPLSLSVTTSLSHHAKDDTSTSNKRTEIIEEGEQNKRSITSANINRYFEDQMFQGRVQLLRRLYGGGCWVTQDDSAVEMSSFSSTSSASSEAANMFSLLPETLSFIKRRGSCESGFFSSGFGRNYNGLSSRQARATSSTVSGGCGIDDWCSVGMMSSSARSAGSSLLTVSDLEEDLRAASIFLSSKRTSSIFTDDSVDDLSSLADLDSWDQRLARSTSTPHGSDANIIESSTPNSRFSGCGAAINSSLGGGAIVGSPENRYYEKDIRDIVDYFNSITINPETVGSGSRISHGTSRTSRQKELDLLFGRKLSNGGPSNKASNGTHQTYSKKEYGQGVGLHSHYSQKNLLPRSHKIESLIKRVAEKESKQRYRKTFGAPGTLSASMFQQHQQRLQVCDGIGKLPF